MQRYGCYFEYHTVFMVRLAGIEPAAPGIRNAISGILGM